MPETRRRARNTGCVTSRGESYWIAIAPQRTRGGKQFRVATCKTKRQAEHALDAWLVGKGRIVRRELGAEKRARRIQ
jgi:hypothetical protein